MPVIIASDKKLICGRTGHLETSWLSGAQDLMFFGGITLFQVHPDAAKENPVTTITGRTNLTHKFHQTLL